MSRKQQTIEDGGPNVPAYIVTFSDMVTLLLTFFVMLLSLAQMQDPDLFVITRDAFVEHINDAGLGVLLGQKVTPELGKSKVKYFVSDPDKRIAIRTIDAREENARRIFKKISKSMETRRSEIVSEKNNFSVTNISFSPGESQLNESAKKFLTAFSVNLQQDIRSGEVKLCVLGLARDEGGEKRQWILSAERAQSVADFLKCLLPSELRCPVYSWGTGSGGRWIDSDSPVSKQSQILIAVLRNE